jgi:hypothetical protein
MDLRSLRDAQSSSAASPPTALLRISVQVDARKLNGIALGLSTGSGNRVEKLDWEWSSFHFPENGK